MSDNSEIQMKILEWQRRYNIADGDPAMALIELLNIYGYKGGGTTQVVDIGTCNSIANQATVNPGCVSYDGCAKPTLFCNHNDPNYIDNGTPSNHGWPCFANNEIFSFFEATR